MSVMGRLGAGLGDGVAGSVGIRAGAMSTIALAGQGLGYRHQAAGAAGQGGSSQGRQ